MQITRVTVGTIACLLNDNDVRLLGDHIGGWRSSITRLLLWRVSTLLRWVTTLLWWVTTLLRWVSTLLLWWIRGTPLLRRIGTLLRWVTSRLTGGIAGWWRLLLVGWGIVSVLLDFRGTAGLVLLLWRVLLLLLLAGRVGRVGWRRG